MPQGKLIQLHLEYLYYFPLALIMGIHIYSQHD